MDLSQITRFPATEGDAHMDVAASVPVPDSQESIFSFAAASSSQDVPSADAHDETNVAVPSSQDNAGNHDPELVEITNALRSLQAADRSFMAAPSTAPRADVPLSDETPPCDPFATGACHCPWCPGSSFSTGRAFVRHLTCMHEGVAIDDTMLQLLRALGRGACPKTGCGCLRRTGSRHCHRCAETHTLRRIVLGDIIPGARGVPLRTVATPAPDHVSSSTAGGSACADVTLPENFTERVRRIPPHTTLVHIPAAVRIKIAIATTECFEGIAADLRGWGMLEEGRSKRLFSCIPDGAHVLREVAIRTSLLSARKYGDLLNRIEMQMVNRRNATSGRRKKKQKLVEEGCANAPHKDRAFKSVKEGAYRKAIDAVSEESSTQR